jgi:hypothetical protein
MHDERSCPCRDTGGISAARHDANAERSVLAAVVDAYPELFTENELVREIADDPEDFIQRDRVERAVRTLSAVGLLHLLRPLIVPSRAALRFDALEELSER